MTKQVHLRGTENAPKYDMPILKRLFDIIVSFFALLALSPLFIFISIGIYISSKGPIFYKSKRVGTNYKIFNFYKFRSMRTNADSQLKQLSHLNQYTNTTIEPENIDYEDYLCEDCRIQNLSCQSQLILDDTLICEKLHKEIKDTKKAGTFIKIQNDPRVFKFGSFLRNSSLDELPQLINVLIGDMSIVGNRPLPLYEAEKLTTDNYTRRFLAPAGITGLWQVTKRGKAGPMSEEERIALDNFYAQKYSLKQDLMILLRTIPALLQKENV